MRNPTRSRRPRRTKNHKLRGLAAARLRAGLSQAELARQSGVSRPSISRLEYLDYAATPLTIIKLARAVRVEPIVLVEKRDGNLAMNEDRAADLFGDREAAS